jgi:hypothetical protein
VDGDKLQTGLKYSPPTTGLPLEFEQNKSITDMRAEVAKGPDWLNELHWALRLSATPDDPVITCHSPLGVESKGLTGFEGIFAP